MWSSGVTSPETLATLPVYINSSKMEVRLSGWLGTSQFNKPINHSLGRRPISFP